MEAVKYTLENLKCGLRTFRTSTRGTGKDKKVTCHSLVQTPVGEMEVDKWIKLMQKAIKNAGESEIYSRLLEYAVNLPWIHSEKEAIQYATELHSLRIFENPEWVGYEKWQKGESYV